MLSNLSRESTVPRHLLSLTFRRRSELGIEFELNLLRDDATLGRLRRIHYAFGEALREEQMCRELDLLLYEH